MTIKNKKIAKRACAVMLSLALAMGTMAPATTAEAAGKGKVTAVTVKNVDGSTLVIKKGKKFTLKTKVNGTGKFSKKLKYKTSNKKIVKVSSKGKLTAVKNGKAKVTVTSSVNKKAKKTITVVVGTPVTKVTLDQKTISAKVGDKVKLAATVTPAKASVKKIKYVSADEKIATVDTDGNITCVAEGTVKITATAMDGNGKKAVCEVTVAAADKKDDSTVTPTPTDPITPSDDKKDDTKKDDDKKDDDKKDDDKKADDKNDEVELGTPSKLSMEGYQQNPVWVEEFEGTSLNRDDWNVELHEPGWVNSELQEYVDSENAETNKNIVVKDGKLYLIPIETVDEKGNKSYTSGRVNTQNKHDFKYGLFEAKVKVPAGMGYLPAFWMMPTNENLYGQWPKCGEIDAMEVMGQNTNELYGTIHYGAPHGQKQGTALIKDGKYIAVDSDSEAKINGNYAIENGKSFSDEFHTFSVEWEPDHISWYVDGIKYHEANDWFSAVEGSGEIAYPAPFDQPFYMILNLAVGGSWVGYPNDTTTYGEESAFVIDSVKVYQKDESYYEEKEANAKKPEKVITYKDADENGNYVTNGNFATAIDSEKDWTLHLESDAAGTTCAVADNSIKITPATVGDQTHSIQLKQAGLPLYRGVEYTLSFDAKADAARTMVVDIEGPDKNWTRYFKDTTVELTTENQLFTFDFTMENATDANCSLEFNLGKQDSTVPVTISNVSLKIKDDTKKVDESKLHEVRADGNYVYNGSFQEGAGRLAYWEISDEDKAKVSVTNTNNERRLKVVAPEGTTAAEPVVVKQSNLPLADGKYALTYKAYKDGVTEDAETKDNSLAISVGKETINDALNSEETTYDHKFEFAAGDDTTFTMKFTAPGTYYVDDIMICEDAMIKNGSFNAGLAGFTQYTYEAASSEYTIDNQQEGNDNTFAITIKDTGDKDWHVQLYQDGVNLEKDKCYRLAFKAKSSLDRNITCVIQRNDSALPNDKQEWTPYFTAIKAELTSEWQTFTKDFKMKNPSDPVARFGFSMGKIDEQITTQHHIYIDDITLIEIEEKDADIPENKEVPANPIGVNLLKNNTFEKTEGVVSDWNTTVANWEDLTAAADITFSDGKAAFDISDVGSDVWHVQLTQTPVALKGGEKYQVSFKIISTSDRNIVWGVQHNGGLDGSNNYDGYCGGDEIAVTSDEDVITETFTMPADDALTTFYISMGKMTSNNNATGTITISEPVLKRIEDVSEDGNLIKNADFSDSSDAMKNWVETIAVTDWGNDGDGIPYTAAAARSINEGAITYDITNVGHADWHISLKQPVNLSEGKSYKVTFDIVSSVDRTIKSIVQDVEDGGTAYNGWDKTNISLKADETEHVTHTFTMTKDATANLVFSMGAVVPSETLGEHTITISNIKFVEVTE